MWTNKVTSVRQLARDFYDGEISQEEYRRERTLQLELISAGANPYGDDEKTRPRDVAMAADIDSPSQSVTKSFIDKLKNESNQVLIWVELNIESEYFVKRLQEENNRAEAMAEHLLLGGKTDAGQEPEKPKVLTDTEYAEALEKGEVNPMKEDGFA